MTGTGLTFKPSACVVCRAPIAQAATGRPRRYCSHPCQVAAWARRNRERHLAVRREGARRYRARHPERIRERQRQVSPEYRAWAAAKVRVTNPNRREWPRYGGRGIDMAPEWVESFAAFLAHVGPRPAPEYSLDRIDNDRGYWPGNVRWATKSEQSRNQERWLKRLREQHPEGWGDIPSATEVVSG